MASFLGLQLGLFQAPNNGPGRGFSHPVPASTPVLVLLPDLPLPAVTQ